MVFGFQTETNFLIIGSLYGHARTNDQQNPLLRFAFQAMTEISREIVPLQLGNKLEMASRCLWVTLTPTPTTSLNSAPRQEHTFLLQTLEVELHIQLITTREDAWIPTNQTPFYPSLTF